MVDAVLRNQSPAGRFPANREKDRDSCLKWASALDFATGICKPRSSVSPAEREPYEKAALGFAADLVSGSAAKAHARMTDELGRYMSEDQLATMIAPNLERFSAIGPLRVDRKSTRLNSKHRR